MVAGGRGPRFTDYGSYAQYLREALARANRRYMCRQCPRPLRPHLLHLSLWTGGYDALFVLAQGATWHPHEHRRRRTAQWAHQSWTLFGLAIGSRPAAPSSQRERCTQPSRLTAASLTNSFAGPSPSVAPRQGVMRPASRRPASSLLAWRDASTPWRAAPTRCLGLCVVFASCAAGSTSTRSCLADGD